MAEELLYDVKDGVATVTLNRPDQRNALNPELLAALVEAMKRARDDEAVRALKRTHQRFAESAGAHPGAELRDPARPAPRAAR